MNKYWACFKIVAIDHEISYIGGMNIGKQYANMDKVKNPWRDTQNTWEQFLNRSKKEKLMESIFFPFAPLM